MSSISRVILELFFIRISAGVTNMSLNIFRRLIHRTNKKVIYIFRTTISRIITKTIQTITLLQMSLKNGIFDDERQKDSKFVYS